MKEQIIRPSDNANTERIKESWQSTETLLLEIGVKSGGCTKLSYVMGMH